MTHQEKLAKIDSLIEDMRIVLKPMINDHAITTVKADLHDIKALITELQEELKPKEIDVERIAGVIDIFQDEVSWQPHESRNQLIANIRDKVVAEIERQRNDQKT